MSEWIWVNLCLRHGFGGKKEAKVVFPWVRRQPLAGVVRWEVMREENPSMAPKLAVSHGPRLILP